MPAALIVLAAVAAYHNSFGGAFVYDDIASIVKNPTIQQLWPIWPVLSPPSGGETVGGRPLLNLSLAINYALGRLDVRGYHATNLAIHIAAALLLFGILRRTFLTPVLRDRFGGAATPLALASALLWAVHPLQTESVTYIVQRAESLAGCLYLLTLYCVIRGVEAARSFIPRPSPLVPRFWYAAAVLACLLGMACKEVMVTAPLIVLLYDRTFLGGSFSEARRRRWGLYVGLAATWGLLVYLLLSTGLIGRQAELGAPDPWSYARTQPGVILHYLRLSLWPSPLSISYGWPVASGFWEVFPGSIAVGLLLAATVWGLVRRRAWGLLGAWLLLILVPTSSILPLNALAYEHRMYLSLAAVTVLAVAGGFALWDRLLPRPAMASRGATAMRWAAPVAAWAAMLLALGHATVARNSDYQSLLALWQHEIDNRPHSPFAHSSFADALAAGGRYHDAIAHYEQALRLKPDDAEAHNNLGSSLAAMGMTSQAIEHFHAALRSKPDFPVAYDNLGLALADLGRFNEAIPQYQQALRLKPDYADAHYNLGISLAAVGMTSQAIQHYRQALRLNPRYVKAHNNLGTALATLGTTNEAIEHFHAALRLEPDYAEAHHNLATALASAGRTREAIEHYDQALRRRPDFIPAMSSLAWLLATRDSADGGDPARAVPLAERLRLLSANENARCLDILAAAYAAAGRFADAVTTAQRATELAQSTGQAPLAKAIAARLELYRAGRPYREAM